jgi:hypothetical protein
MGCGRLSCRHEFQELLERLNPGAAAAAAAQAAASSPAQQAQQDALRLVLAGTRAPLGPSLQVCWGIWGDCLCRSREGRWKLAILDWVACICVSLEGAGTVRHGDCA